MTTYEEIHENLPLRSRHLVNFSKKNENIFYIYDDNKWIKVRNVDSLPYHLTIYQSDDGKEIPTCEDSYRIITKEQYDNNEIPSLDELEYEGSWRNKLKTKDEVDFYLNDGWIKAQIGWIKADIIPNIWNIFKRKSRDWIGYFYYESKRFAPSCTYTEKYTNEFLEKEKKEEEEIFKRIEEKELRYSKILNSLPSIREKDGINTYSSTLETYNVKFTLDYYLTLDIQERLTDTEFYSVLHESVKNDIHTEFQKNLISIIHKNCDGCISYLQTNLINYNKEYNFVSEKYDGYYDIYIEYDNKIKEEVFLYIGDIKIKGLYNERKNIIEFLDFHKNNPLIYGNKFRISSKSFTKDMNIKCYYKGILLNSEPRTLLLGKNGFTPIYIKSQKSYIFVNVMDWNFSIDEENIEIN